MRWSATGVVEAALGERLLDPAAAAPLAAAAARRVADPDLLPADEADRAVDARLAELAAILALRRHGRERDLRDVRLVIGSGGVLRHGGADHVLAAPLTDHAGGWPLPRAAIAVVDRDYVLAPAGLLAAEYPDAALALLRSRLPTAPVISQ